MKLPHLSLSALLLVCLFMSCSDSSNPASEGPGEETKPPASISLSGSQKQFQPGDAVYLEVENFDLVEEYYEGSIQQMPIDIYRVEEQSDTLVFLAPALEPGTHSMHFSFAPEAGSIEFQIVEYELIEEVEEYVSESLGRFIDELRLVNESMDDPAISDVIDLIDQYKSDLLDTNSGNLQMLGQVIRRFSDEEIVEGNEPESILAEGDFSECSEISAQLGRDLARLGVALTGVYTGLSMALNPGLPGIGQLGGVVIVGAAYRVLLRVRTSFNRNRRLIIGTCVSAVNSTLEGYLDPGLKVVANQTHQEGNVSFQEGIDSTFEIHSTYQVTEEFQSIFLGLKEVVDKYSRWIPGSWKQDLIVDHDESKYNEKTDPAGFSIEQISDERISGEIISADGRINLAFSFLGDDRPDEPQYFTFRLVKEEGGYDLLVNAELTPQLLPTIKLEPLEDISENSAFARAAIENEAEAEILERGFCYAEHEAPDENDSCVKVGGGDDEYTFEFTGLNPGQTYYVRAFIEMDHTRLYSNEEVFETTEVLTPPIVTLYSPEDIMETSVMVTASVENETGTRIFTRGFCISVNRLPDGNDRCLSAGMSDNPFNLELTGLIPGRTYYVRAYVYIEQGYVFSNEMEFVTEDQISGWYSGTYTLDSSDLHGINSTTYFCGEDHGKTGRFYVYLKRGRDGDYRYSIYYPSVIADVPNLNQVSKVGDRFESKNNFNYMLLSVGGWSEKIGTDNNYDPPRDLFNSFSRASLRIEPAVGMSVQGSGWSFSYGVPRGSGHAECARDASNSVYKYRYRTKNIQAHYLGKTPPPELSSARIETIYSQIEGEIQFPGRWFED